MGKSLIRPPSSSSSSSCSSKSNYNELREALLRAVSGIRRCVVFPEQSGYRAANVGCNLEVSIKPTAITFPQKLEHIQNIVKVASRFSLHVQARSGGHSYGNYGRRSALPLYGRH
jgi:hypothetical protein